MKKLLSIILAILMIVTTIPMAFAADETPDFSDAKVLTTVDGVLYIDGVEAETNSSKSQSRIYEGKYILEGDIETSRYIWIFGDTTLDLNGYTWNLTDKYIIVNAPLSIYDTSEAETGKITSGSSSLTITINDVAAGFNLYGGTIENTSSSGRCALDVSSADVNLYAGKIKSNSQAIRFALGREITLNIDGTVLESGDDYADVLVSLGTNDIAKGDIDVTDYKGDSLTAKVNVISTLGKITVFKGIKNTQEAEKYQITDVVCDEYYDLFWEKTEYDENTGEKSIYTANNAFTQQPSAENGYTVDFNNSDATFQWYEVEETVLTPDNVTSIDGDFENDKWSYGGWYAEFFTVDVNAGDMITASTTSTRSFDLIVYTEDYSINEYVRTTGKASVTIDSDAEVIVAIDVDVPNETTEFEFKLIRTSELDEIETDKTLQNPECGKTYVCKTSVGENVYLSDVVTVGHNIVSVDAKAPTCTEIGWDAYEYCTACTYTTYVELSADPDAHTPLEAVKENEVAPKCDVAGSYDLVVYCDDCGAELDRDTKTVDALTHTDADGDYICDHGCGYEYEKPEEPTPEEPIPEEPTPEEPTEDTICEDCGKVHDGFFAELICFFTRIINFIKNLFA